MTKEAEVLSSYSQRRYDLEKANYTALYNQKVKLFNLYKGTAFEYEYEVTLDHPSQVFP